MVLEVFVVGKEALWSLAKSKEVTVQSQKVLE